MALFVSMLYMQHWYKTVSLIRAPTNGVYLILALKWYPDKKCRELTIQAIYWHLGINDMTFFRTS